MSFDVHDHEPSVSTKEESVLPAGAKLGRYTILETLGVGGMATVYAAYDSELDRKVALKVFFREVWTQHTDVLKEIIAREAKALAKLAHPNVVTVFEVGTTDGELFIAMEHVEGRALSEWLRERERGWREVVDVLVEAGRGLAAAHAAGLVHRDFKPDNVLVGDDGRVRVTDFGLARENRAQPTAGDEALSGVPALRRRRSRVTDSGLIMGTPAYMSPEQLMGKSADARSDIYSFCLTLYGAAYRQRPYSGETVSELRAQVFSEDPRPPPKETRVPAKVREVIRRGMKVKPEERFDDMCSLLKDLSDIVAPRTRDWRVWLALGLAVAAVCIGLLLVFLSERRQPCRTGEAQIAKTWNNGRRAAIRAAFAATRAPFADRAATKILAELDGYASEWAGMHRDACEATHVRSEQSVALLDLRMQCLERERAQLDAIVTALEAADVQTVYRASELRGSFAEIEECANVDSLTSTVRLPLDPAVRERIEQASQKLADARAKIDLGKYDSGLPLAQEVVAEAEAVRYDPLKAEALLAEGQALWRIGKLKESVDSLVRAAAAGEAGRLDRAKVLAWTELVYVVGYELGNPSEARIWHDLARAGVRRLSMSPSLVGKVEANWAAALFRAGRIAESLEAEQTALEISEKELGSDHPLVGMNLSNMGTHYLLMGDMDRAFDYTRRGLDIRRKALGDEHPDVAESVNNLGNVLVAAGKLDEAEEQYQRAYEMWKAVLGERHSRIAVSLTNLGGLAARRGDLDRALELVGQAYDIERQALGDDHLALASTHGNLGNLLAAKGDYAAAEAHYREALAIGERVVGGVHPSAASALTALAATLLELERFKEAEADALRARYVWNHVGAPPASLAENEFVLARALDGQNGRRAEAVERAAEALRLYGTAGPTFAESQSEVADWLAARGRATN